MLDFSILLQTGFGKSVNKRSQRLHVHLHLPKARSQRRPKAAPLSNPNLLQPVAWGQGAQDELMLRTESVLRLGHTLFSRQSPTRPPFWPQTPFARPALWASLIDQSSGCSMDLERVAEADAALRRGPTMRPHPTPAARYRRGQHNMQCTAHSLHQKPCYPHPLPTRAAPAAA